MHNSLRRAADCNKAEQRPCVSLLTHVYNSLYKRTFKLENKPYGEVNGNTCIYVD
jgi:hypothetical protein